MSRRSKREVAPPPPPAASVASAPGHFDTTMPTSLQTASAMTLPAGAQSAWWNGSMPQTNSFDPASRDYGMDLHPPGGFLSYFQTVQQPFIPPHVSIPPPWPSVAPVTHPGTKHATLKSKAKDVVNIDDRDDVRTAKRLSWEPDEDSRLGRC